MQSQISEGGPMRHEKEEPFLPVVELFLQNVSYHEEGHKSKRRTHLELA
jgi:hypothetical protein